MPVCKVTYAAEGKLQHSAAVTQVLEPLLEKVDWLAWWGAEKLGAGGSISPAVDTSGVRFDITTVTPGSPTHTQVVCGELTTSLMAIKQHAERKVRGHKVFGVWRLGEGMRTAA